MLENYEQKRLAVLDLANTYLKDRQETEDIVPLKEFQAILKNLQDSKYILAVVGEVKAGKSTFINALLKEEVLPSGVLQNTKAIIEIEKPKEDEKGRKYIKVVWGNKDKEGKNIETTFESENTKELNDYLKTIAAVDERYRDIPTTVIDSYLLDDIIDPPIEVLEKEGEYSSLKGKENLIKSYIEEYKDKSKIPVEIHYVYPLRYSFSDLVVIDSPGVNAKGGIQKRTKESIYRANAIIFVRSLETPAEHTSFLEFYRETIPDRPKETLFLVFTKTQGKINQLKLKIKGIKENLPEISEEKIIGVDSLYRLLQFELEKYKSPEELINHYKNQMQELTDLSEKGNNSTEASNNNFSFNELSERLAVLENKLEILEKIPYRENKELFFNELKKISNFDKMEEIIEKFSTQAPLEQLQRILKSIRNGYEYQSKILRDKIKDNETKIEDPQLFETRIRDYEEALKKYEEDINNFIRCLDKKYTVHNAFYMQDINKIKNIINNISKQDSEDKITKECENIKDMIRTVTDTVVKKISEEVSNYFIKKGVEFKEKYDITIPIVDVNTLKTYAMESAYDEIDEYIDKKKTRLERKWYTLWLYRHTIEYVEKEKTGTTKVFNKAKYLEDLKRKLEEIYEILLENLQEKHIKPVVNKYVERIQENTDYSTKVRKDYMNEQKKKKTNDQIISEVKDFKKKLLEVEGELKEVKNQEGLL